MRFLFNCLIFSVTIFFIYPSAPHVQSSYTFRVTNRKYINHILHELRGGKNYVTILTTHGPSYNAFRSDTHALYYPCKKYSHCIKTIKILNDYLNTGENLGLKLNGSVIEEVIYYKK